MPEASARPETGLGRCGAWHLLGRLVRAPAQLVREEHETYERILRDPPSRVDAEEQAETRRFFRQQLRKRAVSLVRSLHAASRTAEAAEEACRCAPSADMAEALAAARE